jgi:hypothetical protein
MSTHFTLDGESFQNLLARAFLAQEYLESQKAQRPDLDFPPKRLITEQPKEAIPPDYIQSLYAIFEVQRLIATEDLEVDGAMALIADRAREVANATGVAIGQLEGDELVYRAGSGSVTSYVGRRVKATLSVSGHNRANGEILRVENAETDARIEAAICRQFGAKALLIVPICYDRAVAGAVEILFGEAHAFQDYEVRTYQLMAGLIAEAKSHAAQLARKQALAAEQAKTQPHRAELPGAASAEGAELPLVRWLAGAVVMITQGAKRLHLHQRRWIMAAVLTALIMAGWIGYVHRGPASAPAKLVSPNSSSKPQTARLPAQPKKAARTTPRRSQVWRNQADYIAEDVTVRYFTPKSAIAPPKEKKAARTTPPRSRAVDYIAEDVTVHYFIPKPGVAPPKEPIRTATQPAAQPIQPPVVVHTADEPRIKQIRSKK